MAHRWGVVHQNIVATLLDAPKVRAEPVDILPPAKQAAIERLRGRLLHAVAVVALGTGARRNEVLALRWSDIDLDGGTLRIERALEQTTRGWVGLQDPEDQVGEAHRHAGTRHRRRVTAGAPSRSAGATARARDGEGSPTTRSCSTTPDGAPLSPNAITQEWARAMGSGGAQGDAAQLAAHPREHADQCRDRRAHHQPTPRPRLARDHAQRLQATCSSPTTGQPCNRTGLSRNPGMTDHLPRRNPKRPLLHRGALAALLFLATTTAWGQREPPPHCEHVGVDGQLCGEG